MKTGIAATLSQIKPAHRDNGALIKGHFKRHVLGAIGSKYADDIRRADIMSVLDTIRKDGKKKRVANVVLQNLRRMFRYAQKREILMVNPADLVGRGDAGGREKPRERYLSEEELKHLGKMLPAAGLEETSQAAILLLLATLVRVGALCQAKWRDIKFKEKLWRAWDLKKDTPEQYELPLSDFAITQLKRIKSEQKRRGIDTDWVMYSRKDPKQPLIEGSLNKQIQDRQKQNDRKRRVSNNLLSMAGGQWTIRDIRRTGASHMKRLGVLPEVRRACMNHAAKDRLEQVYDREEVPLEHRRAAFDLLGKHLSQLLVNS